MNSFYLRATSSPHWYELKRQAMRRAGSRCECLAIVFDRDGRAVHEHDGPDYVRVRCEATGNLQLHHRHYGTLGNEGLEDVQILCDRCHRVATVLELKYDACRESVCGDEENAWVFVASQASLQSLSAQQSKIIDLARAWFGSLCPVCDDRFEHTLAKDD